MNTIDLQVEGMSCGSCVKHVTQALQSLPGVGGVEVDLASGRVRVSGELAPGGDSLMTALTVQATPRSWPQTLQLPLRPRRRKPRAATAAARGVAVAADSDET